MIKIQGHEHRVLEEPPTVKGTDFSNPVKVLEFWDRFIARCFIYSAADQKVGDENTGLKSATPCRFGTQSSAERCMSMPSLSCVGLEKLQEQDPQNGESHMHMYHTWSIWVLFMVMSDGK